MKTKKNLYVLCVILFLRNLVFYSPVGTIYRQSRGLSMYQIFMLESIFMVLMIFLEVPWGHIADKIGYKKTIIISYFVFMTSKIVFYKADSFILFFIEVVLLAIAISGISGCDSALIYSSISEEESEKAFSMYSACGTAGFFTASILSVMIIKKSVDFAVFVTIIPYLIICFCVLLLKDIEHNKEEKTSMGKSFKTVFNNKTILIFVLSTCLIGEVWRSIVVFLNQPQYLRCGISAKYFGIIAAVMSIVSMISIKAYKFSKKFGQKRVLILLYITLTIGIFSLVFTKNAVITILIMAVIEMSYSICGPLQADIENKSITTKDRATILSIYAMVTDLGAALINIFIGKASNRSTVTGFIMCGSLGCISVVMLLVYYKVSEK